VRNPTDATWGEISKQPVFEQGRMNLLSSHDTVAYWRLTADGTQVGNQRATVQSRENSPTAVVLP